MDAKGIANRLAPQVPPEHDPFTASIESKFGVPPPALRAFVTTLAGDRSPITESFFTPNELDILRRTAAAKVAEGKNVIGYGDYGENDPWSQGTQGVIDALTDPAKSLAFTIGMANVNSRPDGGLAIKDRYDFAAKPEVVDQYRDPVSIARLLMTGLKSNGLLGVGNVIGNFMAPEGAGRDVLINLPQK